jgi:hypothetical protein
MANATMNYEALSDTEARKLYDRLAHRFRSTARQRAEREPTFSADERGLWMALSAVCRRPMSGTASNSALAAFCQSYGRKQFQARLAELDAYLDSACGVKLRRPERDALRRIALQSLADRMSTWVSNGRPLPIVPKTVLNSFEYLVGAVEDDFPGYAEAGLLHRALLPIAA